MKSRKRNAVCVIAIMVMFGIAAVVVRWPKQPVSSFPVMGPVARSNSLEIVGLQPTNAQSPPRGETPFRAKQHQRLTLSQLMKESLDLSDEQIKKLEPLLQEQQETLAAFRGETSLSRPYGHKGVSSWY